jgi:SAM-dependent methyltransferase
MVKTLKIMGLALREAATPAKHGQPRIPEPSAEMNTKESVEGFHNEGTTSLLPIYHFNACAIAALAPRGASVVDIGCGTGQLLSYVARCRPDLQITGIDLAGDMVSTGSEMLARQGLAQRVRLVVGDMREFRSVAPSRIDLVTSIFSLHHLPTHDDLHACVREMGAAVATQQARLWIFDHARPKRHDTAHKFPEIFTPAASSTFKLDSYNSLRASWSFIELCTALRSSIGTPLTHRLAKLLPLYQLHWLGATLEGPDRVRCSFPEGLTASATKDAKSLARLFDRPPGW